MLHSSIFGVCPIRIEQRFSVNCRERDMIGSCSGLDKMDRLLKTRRLEGWKIRNMAEARMTERADPEGIQD